MARLSWGKKAITEGCINKWYKDKPIGRMVAYMRDNHRLLAQEHGGGKYKDSVLVYDTAKFLQALNLHPETQFPNLNNWTGQLTEKHVELSVAVNIWRTHMYGKNPIQETFL